MNDKTEGIVISNSEYRENDSLLKVLTKDFGVLGFIVRGTKKMTSKRSGVIQLGNQALFYFDHKERSGLQQLKQVELLNPYTNIQNDLLRQTIRQYVCELCCKLDQIDVDIYTMIELFLQELDTTKVPLILLSILQAQINDMFGIGMQVDHCVICGSTSNIVSISIDQGGFVCTHCAKPGMRKEEVIFLRNFRYIVKCKLEDIDKLSALVDEDERYFMILVNNFEQFSGFYMKSKKFLETVLSMSGR